MPYIPPEVVEKAREMDLLTYLKSYEPQELVHFGGNTYCTREHDSLKISNGKWCWFSRGIGGYSALDYLIKVKEMPFMQAVETIMHQPLGVPGNTGIGGDLLGNDFQEASVRQLIFNEVYAGDIRRQKCYMADPITKMKVKNYGELPQYYMADCHEAIIDRETYAKVQAEMERRAGFINPTYPFTGKIKCGICGQNFTRRKGITKGKEYVSWFCRAKKEVGMTCRSHNYSEQKLMEICAGLMGTGSFDGAAFERSVRLITSLPNGSLEMQFFDGRTKRWEMPPKPAKLPDKPVKKRPAHLFDGKISCGQCGRRFGRAVSESKDRHLYLLLYNIS